MARRLAVPTLLAATLAVGVAGVSAAQDADAAASPAAEESWSGEMIDELMSPYCPGRTLRNCPSSDAGELIHWIEAQDAQGREREEVFNQLLSEYGDEIRQAPVATGWGAAAYVVPVLAFVAGGVLVGLFLRRQGRAREAVAPAASGPPPPGDPDLERQVDEELGRTQ